MNPFESVVCEGECVEEGRACGHGENGCAEVVLEAGECEGQRADCTARLGLGLEDLDSEACLGEANGGGEAVGA